MLLIRQKHALTGGDGITFTGTSKRDWSVGKEEMNIKLLWIDRKYSKKSFGKDVIPKRIVKMYGSILDGYIGLANNQENILGVYKGNGVVRTYGKTAVCKASKEND